MQGWQNLPRAIRTKSGSQNCVVNLHRPTRNMHTSRTSRLCMFLSFTQGLVCVSSL